MLESVHQPEGLGSCGDSEGSLGGDICGVSGEGGRTGVPKELASGLLSLSPLAAWRPAPGHRTVPLLPLACP